MQKSTYICGVQKWHQFALLVILEPEFSGMGVILDADFIYGAHFSPNLLKIRHSNNQICEFGIQNAPFCVIFRSEQN